MRVVFVYPDILDVPEWRGYFYEGVASLGAALEKRGHEPRLVHLVRRESPEAVLERIAGEAVEGPALVAFTFSTIQKVYVEEWAPLVRKKLGLPMIAGGIHATLDPAGTLREIPSLDWVCRGDGEEVLPRVADLLEKGDRPGVGGGLWERDGKTGEIQDGGLAPAADLARLPFPKRDLFDMTGIQGGEQGILSAMSSRGCPFHCTYCCNKTLRETYKAGGQAYIRQKPPERFVEELEEAVRIFPGHLGGFFFEDDIFGVDLGWLEEFSRLYKARLGRNFGCNLRPEMVTPQRVRLLAETGCRRVNMGLESGDESLRREVLGRKVSNAMLEQAFRILREGGISILTYNLLGLPGEGVESLLKTIKLNARLAPDEIQNSILFPFQGTEIFDRAKEEGLLSKRRVLDYFQDTALDLPGLSRRQILFFQARFQGLVAWYRRLGRLPGWLGRSLEALTDQVLRWPWVPALFGPRRPKGKAG